MGVQPVTLGTRPAPRPTGQVPHPPATREAAPLRPPGRRRPTAGCPERATGHGGPGDQRRVGRRASPARSSCSARTSQKGGVYGVTRGLPQGVGGDRVFDTLLDEQSILGLAIGAASPAAAGPRDPVPRLPATTPRTSCAARRRRSRSSRTGSTATGWSCGSPATGTRRASAGTSTTTTGGGAARHAGLVIAVAGRRPTTPRRCCGPASRAAAEDGTVCVFLEPIARYHTVDLHEPGDRGWLEADDRRTEHVPIGSSARHGEGRDLSSSRGRTGCSSRCGWRYGSRRARRAMPRVRPPMAGAAAARRGPRRGGRRADACSSSTRRGAPVG